MPSPMLRTIAAGLTAAALLFSTPGASLAEGIHLVRDAEAETLISDYARPLLKAAGLGSATIDVRIVADRSFNAFVVDSRHIFIHTGAVIDCKRPNQLIGVLAHEIGHLAANHLAQLRQQLTRMRLLTILAVLGGAGAGIATGNGQAGAAAALGGVQFGQRSMLAYAREQESAADSAALRYLDATHQSAKGMMETFDDMANEQLFASAAANPYLLSHPLARDRLAQIEERAHQSKYFDAPDQPALQTRHDLVRAKFIAFTGSAQQVMRAYPPSDASLPADYARAIAAYRTADPKAAIASVDALLKRDPRDPYFWELKGQILIESGSPRLAIEPLRKAVALAPSAGLIRSMLGQAMVASGDDKLVDEAIAMLEKATSDDADQPLAFAQLAIAYARKGNIPFADLASAQGALASGDLTLAKRYALRAQGNLKTGSAAWLRADDIVTYKPGP